MPELPEVETVRRGLEPVLVGATIARVELRRGDLRKPFPKGFAKALTGQKVVALTRRAKYLVAELGSGDRVVMHLGMSGSFRIDAAAGSHVPGVFAHPRGAVGTHDHVILHLKSGATVTYNDPRRFGSMDLIPRGKNDAEPLSSLGFEPLGPELSGPALMALFKGRRTPVKSALLDQKLIAGLGNIYVCEGLWGAGISPKRLAGEVSAAQAKRLAAAIPEVLNRAIEAGGTSLRNHLKPDGTLGMFQHSFRVYDQEGEPCQKPRCHGVIAHIVQAGRSTFYCPVCQR